MCRGWYSSKGSRTRIQTTTRKVYASRKIWQATIRGNTLLLQILARTKRVYRRAPPFLKEVKTHATPGRYSGSGQNSVRLFSLP